MRHTRLQRFFGALTTTLMVATWGCGDGPPSAESSTAEATISGTVTIKGKRATGGDISFDPSNVNRKMEAARRTQITKEGTYTVKTLVGDNAVRISTPELNKDRQLGGQQYTFDAKAGENTYDLVIPSPSSAAPAPAASPGNTGR